MSYFSVQGRMVALAAFERILSTFKSLENIYGFMYFIMVFGEYSQLLYYVEKSVEQVPKKQRLEGKFLYSDSKIIREAVGSIYDVIGPCIGLRNGFAHWGKLQIEGNFDALRVAISSVDIELIQDTNLRKYAEVLKHVDYNYIKSELLRISPELNL